MGILAQCPVCNIKQSLKNKLCKKCSENLDKAKNSKRVKYWIDYRFDNGKQKREVVGYSISEARDALGKKKSQKREGKLFDIKEDAKMTFNELTEWYLSLEKVKSKSYYQTIIFNLRSFNDVFGQQKMLTMKAVDLENYQEMRKKEGLSDSYIDQHIGAARSMVNKAFDNDKISGDAVKPFKKVNKLLNKNSNARNRILSHDEFISLCEHSTRHIKDIVVTAYHTGMRRGEILNLTWDKVDMKTRFINLEPEDTKDKEKRSIPICDEVNSVLQAIPRNLHDNHVFMFRGKPVSDIRTGLVRACNKAGIIYGRKEKDGFTFHDLRHTFNTNMRKAGVPESVIMKITGHSTREMFDRYNTVDEDDSREAVDRLELFLRNVDQTVDHEGKTDSKATSI